MWAVSQVFPVYKANSRGRRGEWGGTFVRGINPYSLRVADALPIWSSAEHTCTWLCVSAVSLFSEHTSTTTATAAEPAGVLKIYAVRVRTRTKYLAGKYCTWYRKVHLRDVVHLHLQSRGRLKSKGEEGTSSDVRTVVVCIHMTRYAQSRLDDHRCACRPFYPGSSVHPVPSLIPYLGDVLNSAVATDCEDRGKPKPKIKASSGPAYRVREQRTTD